MQLSFSKRRKSPLARLFWAIIYLALLGGVGLEALWWDAVTPTGATSDSILIDRHSGSRHMAAQLAEAGMVRCEPCFRLTAGAYQRLTKQKLKAGEYAFPAPISPLGMLEKFARGEVIIRKFTVPEGQTSAQILARLAREPFLTGDAPASLPEGSLMPETYHYTRGDSRASIVEAMQKGMKEYVAKAWDEKPVDVPLTGPDQLVVMASLIEKETGRPDERPRVAAVFYNRLKQGMPLQTDPTVIYALTEGKQELGRPLTLADLQVPHPYNTYLNPGLPPGPIANPGKASIDAALHPAPDALTAGELYFVADGLGGHRFSATLNDHNKNVADYRALKKGPANKGPEAPAR
ncbi:endolytic transglycosylase MltG [bacterium]|nr:endolytic transglycosylase MltG [bacterium]